MNATATIHKSNRCLKCRISTTDLTLRTCPKGHKMIWHFVNGTLNEAKLCAGPCVNAFGADCECSCGGAHHGRFA